jgi:hypothetical protein
MPLEMKYFVLKPKAKSKKDIWAEASQNAMFTFADTIREEDPELFRELVAWGRREILAQERLKE